MNTTPQKPATITRRVRRRKTSRAVRLGDVAARVMITLGGMGAIIAVAGVFVFLLWVAGPLFHRADVQQQVGYAGPWRGDDASALLHLAMDDHQSIAWAVTADGMLHVFRLDNAELLERRPLFDDQRTLTAASFGERHGDAVFGFDDGSIQMARIGFQTRFVNADEMPDATRALDVWELGTHEQGVITRMPHRQFRLRSVVVELAEPVESQAASAIVRISHTERAGRTIFASYTQEGRLLLNEVRERRNLLSGEVRLEVRDSELPFELPPGRDAPDHLAMAGLGDNIFVIWNDGHLLRYDLRDRENPRLAEAIDLVSEPGERLTAVGYLIGRHSLVTGDSQGRTRVWFRIAKAQAEAAAVPDAIDAGRLLLHDDGVRMVNAHELPGPGAPVTALGSAMGSRMLSVGYGDGTVRLFHVTADNLVLQTEAQHDAPPIENVFMTPRDNGMLAVSEAGASLWTFDRKFPAVTLRSLMLPVWYEDYAGPKHMWQSSAGSDAFEPKYGLWPLIFGTLKATFYSMLFGLPLALLAAIYTSEFLHRKVRSRLKPIVEMMASLPSVVLGFVAALVIAPWVEHVVPGVIAMFLVVPLAMLTGGYLWQMLPYTAAVRLERWRFAVIVALLPLAGWFAITFVGPALEWLLFAGNLRIWLRGELNGQPFGSGVGGWLILLMPICAIAVALLFGRYVNPWLRERARDWSRARFALLDLAKFAAGVVLAIALAAAVGALLVYGIGWDPRGSVVDTYEQRNALVVGFVMGFAIIPIIYTIAEDALNSVPDHLRSASLGAGATPWQTASRLIVPTAMSGLFSAAMIGLGRAVGETMIVLMAAGNTPVLEVNIFNGFRTLAANIATELPEASVGGTHYRVLFLTALTLFLMTFAVNTIAEIIRLRFRKRAYQL